MLEHLDYEILDYVSKFDKVTKEAVISHFQKSIPDVEYRFDLLCRYTYNQSTRIPGYIVVECKKSAGPFLDLMPEPTGFYCISDKGRKALNDYKIAQKREKRMLWLKNAWIPILVSIVTNLIISALKQLLPLILRLLSHTP